MNTAEIAEIIAEVNVAVRPWQPSPMTIAKALVGPLQQHVDAAVSAALDPAMNGGYVLVPKEMGDD